MKILHVVPTYLPATRYGGPIYSVHALCKALVKKGHEVHVYTTNVDGPGDSPVTLYKPVDVEGVTVWYFPSKWLRRIYWSPPLARALYSQINQFDLVHLHSVFLWPIWSAAGIAWIANIPYVLSPRGMLVRDLIDRKNKWLKKAWISYFGRRVINRASAIHVTSAQELSELSGFKFNILNISNIPNGVELQHDYNSEQASMDVREIISKKPLILFVGRINWKKGLERLILAMNDVPKGHLAIIGNDEENYLPKLEKIISDNSLQKKITILPRIIKEIDKQILYGSAYVFTLVSYSENFGNSALEAMASSCPVITTPEVGLSDYIRDKNCGFIVYGGPDRIAEAINRIISNNNLRNEMADNAYNIAKTFSWESVTEKMLSLYTSVIDATKSNHID